jgi:hypothetical protein
MRPADSKSKSGPSEAQSSQSATRIIPTFLATDPLEKLIADRDALAVHKIVTEGPRH